MERITPLYVIITAGGYGKRMEAGIAKQFIELKGVPVLYRTIELFLKMEVESEIILVLPSDYKEYWKKYCIDHSIEFRHRLVSGGITRFHSVKNALELVPGGARVLIHDGVRPFVPKELLSRLLDFRMGEGDAYGVIPVVCAVDSMRELQEDGSTRVVRREKYLSVQTPQLFDSGRLKRAYGQAYSPSFTDDASVFESAGYRIATVEGSRLNIKITVPDDLTLGTAILSLE